MGIEEASKGGWAESTRTGDRADAASTSDDADPLAAVPTDATGAKRQRIILLLDGTWNDAEFSTRDTNIVRLREVIAASLAERSTPLRAGAGSGPPDEGQGVAAHTRPDEAGIKHLVYYLRGVGTGAGLDRFKGGGLGEGLETNVRRAYKFLSFYYEAGDEVFVFGFSRGAYTARSLVGYIASAGLLRRESCDPEREQQAWSYYRTPPDDRSPGIWHALGEHVHNRETLRIDCLAVFDTVGALGLPLEVLKRWNRQRFQFHNVELPSITRRNLHAVAIDEHRMPFQAAVWRRHKFKRVEQQQTEQVWFAGDHSDIGGGHLDENARANLPTPALDDIVLEWMLKRVAKYFPAFPFEPSTLRKMDRTAVHAPHHDCRKGKYFLWPRNHRSIANHRVPVGRSEFIRSEVNRGYDRLEMPTGEMVHVSALERLGEPVRCGNRILPYAPSALLAVLDDIEATYSPGSTGAAPKVPIPIVDWSGEILSPQTPNHQECARSLLEAARIRLGARGRSLG